MSKQLWNDERIHRAVEEYWESVVDQCEPRFLLEQMRDEYQIEIDRLTTELEATRASISNDVAYVVAEWMDGQTLSPILVCLSEADAIAELNTFRDVAKVPLKLASIAIRDDTT